MFGATLLLLALGSIAPEQVALHFRPPPDAVRTVVGEVVVGVHDLAPGSVSDDDLLRALRVEAARSGADAVLEVSLTVDAEGQPSARGTLVREGKRHGVRARNGMVLFFKGEGFPPRGEKVRELVVTAAELRGKAPSRRALIGALTRKAQALDARALAMIEVVEGKERSARAVVVQRIKPPGVPPPLLQDPKTPVVGRGVAVDPDWY